MDLETKLDLLAPAARFDVCDSFGQNGRRFTPKKPKKARWPDGTAVDDDNGKARPVLRLLMSSACAWNCAYCPLRADSDTTERATLEPAELARIFLPRYQAGAVQGLFLSTAVDGNIQRAVGQMLDGVEALRTQHQYDGYVHIKLLPGTTAGDVERAARLANRVSLNLEAPGPEYLARVSPERDWHNDLLERLRWAHTWQQHAELPLTGLATQFVVGAAGEQDRDLLGMSTRLYDDLRLRRVYFGAFRPARGTPLESAEATPFLRVQRLHQADWLLRNYGFATGEMPFDAGGNLPLHLDPKLAWALAHPELFPVELNSASPETLLRVPGLGPVSVRRIVRLRRTHAFREPEHLASLGTQAGRARDFVTLDGRFFGRDSSALQQHYAPRGPVVVEQLSFW